MASELGRDSGTIVKGLPDSSPKLAAEENPIYRLAIHLTWQHR
jgi:hypothetical protein